MNFSAFHEQKHKQIDPAGAAADHPGRAKPGREQVRGCKQFGGRTPPQATACAQRVEPDIRWHEPAASRGEELGVKGERVTRQLDLRRPYARPRKPRR